MTELLLGKITDPGKLQPFSLQGTEEKNDPHDHGQNGEKPRNQRADQGDKAAKNMEYHDGSESKDGLQGVKQDEAAAFFECEKHNAADEGE